MKPWSGTARRLFLAFAVLIVACAAASAIVIAGLSQIREGLAKTKAGLQAGRFREDLFYRLNVFPIRLPPLRERKEDIPLLAMHFLDKHARTYRRELSGFTPEALRVLAGYDWPGNVRQLENAVERAAAIATGGQIEVKDLPSELQLGPSGALPAQVLAGMPYRDAVELARDRMSREYLLALMGEFHGNVTQAAERAGMERESLHRLLRRYGVHSDDFKEPVP